MLNLRQIKELKKASWELGYHTRTHPDLRFINKKRLEEEIVMSKKGLEKELGYKIKYFAYPYGLFSKEVIDIVKKAGYEYAFTVSGGKLNSDKSTYKVDRVLVDNFINVNDVKVITSRQGLCFNKFIIKLLHIKDNYYEKL